MAQQINLYHPILLTTKRYFSALAMVQALAAITVGAIALCAWAVMHTTRMRHDLEATQRSANNERQQLVAAIAINPTLGTNTTALEQNLKALQSGLAQRQQTLDELNFGTVVDGRSHSALLRLVAQTVPAPAWLTEIRLSAGRLNLSGMTLEPAALRSWIAELSAHPLLAGQRLGTVRIERASVSAGAGTAISPSTRPLANGTEAWGFTLGNGDESAPVAVATAPDGSKVPNATRIADAAIAAMAVTMAASAAHGGKP